MPFGTKCEQNILTLSADKYVEKRFCYLINALVQQGTLPANLETLNHALLVSSSSSTFLSIYRVIYIYLAISLLLTIDFCFLFHTLCFYCTSDALVAMEKAMKRDSIEVNDRQLACAHIQSLEGQDYLKGMAAAANYAWVNRSSMTFLCRQVRKGDV